MTTNNELISELYDKSAAMYVLSWLMHKPERCYDDNYIFLMDDFALPLHQMVFSAINNLSQNGSTLLTAVDIDMYLKQFDSQYSFYQANKGYDFTQECYKLADSTDESQFDSYYNRMKKFSVLRDFQRQGIDTKRFYNTEDIFNLDEQQRKLNALSIKDIIASVTGRVSEIGNKHIGKDRGDAQSIKTGMRDLIGGFKVAPECGYAMEGELINAAARGMRLGKMYLYSAPSGQGKTRYLVGEACKLSLPYIDRNGKIVYQYDEDGNLDYQKVVYIPTEQAADEIQTLVMAYVSGVDEEHIVLGMTTPEEDTRIEMASQIIESFGDNFIVDTIPDPSIQIVKNRIIHFVVKEDVRYVFYDYIFNSPGLVTEYASSNLREDVVLMMLSNTLKEIAMMYNIHISSATQLNEGWSKIETGPRDQNCLRGSKAIADKADFGVIGVKLRETEKKEIQEIWDNVKKLHPEWNYIAYPTNVADVYKNRRGKLVVIKVFFFFDYATCHRIDLFATEASTYIPIENIVLIKTGIVKRSDNLIFMVEANKVERDGGNK